MAGHRYTCSRWAAALSMTAIARSGRSAQRRQMTTMGRGRPADITKTAVHDHCHLRLALAIILLAVAVPMQRGIAPCPAWRLGLDSGGCFRTVFS